jgi:hypothetical protein
VPVDATTIPTSQPTSSPTLAPIDSHPCNQHTNCGTCLANSCVYCPKWENPTFQFHCQPAQRSCERKRFSYCEDTNSQISANFTVVIKNWLTVTISAGTSGISMSINRVDDPVPISGGLLKVMVYFTSSDSSWDKDQEERACNLIKSSLSSVYEITNSRVGCSFKRLAKRDNLAIDNGEAEVLIAEPGATAPAPGGGIIIIIIF